MALAWKATVTTMSSKPWLLQQRHDVLHHRPVGQGHHRLGRVGGQRPQAGALASGHDHGLHGVALLSGRLATALSALGQRLAGHRARR